MTAAKKPVPASAKKPQDRKPPESVDEDVTATVNGVTITVPADRLDDFEVTRLLARADASKKSAPQALAAFERIVGVDQFDALLDTIRDENGRIGNEAGFNLVGETFKALNPNS